jgi:hypothetical protein
MTDWAYADVWEQIAAAIPDRPAQIQANRTLTWRAFDRRANALAAHLLRAGLQRQAKVAAFLYNAPEYLETYYAAFKAGLVPVNTNYRYGAEELTLSVRQRRRRGGGVPRLLRAADRHDPRPPAQGPDLDRRGPWPATPRRPGPRTTRRSSPAPTAHIAPWGRSGDDHAVPLHRRHHRHAQGRDVAPGRPVQRPGRRRQPARGSSAADQRRRRPGSGPRPRDPGAHAADAGRRAADARHRAVHRDRNPDRRRRGGGAAVAPLQRLELWDEVDRLKATPSSIVGQAFAAPMLEALEANPSRWDVTSLRRIGSSGTVWSHFENKQGLLRHMPGTASCSTAWARPRRWASARLASGAGADGRDRASSWSDQQRGVHRGRPQGRAGLGRARPAGHAGFLPLGYYKDPEKSAKTFRVFEGRRWSVPGDFATVEADGTLTAAGPRLAGDQHRRREGLSPRRSRRR